MVAAVAASVVGVDVGEAEAMPAGITDPPAAAEAGEGMVVAVEAEAVMVVPSTVAVVVVVVDTLAEEEVVEGGGNSTTDAGPTKS
jgi:hypothetical protein